MALVKEVKILLKHTVYEEVIVKTDEWEIDFDTLKQVIAFDNEVRDDPMGFSQLSGQIRNCEVATEVVDIDYKGGGIPNG